MPALGPRPASFVREPSVGDRVAWRGRVWTVEAVMDRGVRVVLNESGFREVRYASARLLTVLSAAAWVP